MSTLQYFFPENRLTKALGIARLRTVREGLKQADANLGQLAAACVEHVDRGLDLIEATMKRWPDSFDQQYLEELYHLSLKLIGVGSVAGLPDLDKTARSFCDVLDGLMTRQLWDRGPVDVHVATMRLLRTPDELGAGLATVMQGLLRVRDRFAVEPPKPPPAPENTVAAAAPKT